MTKSRATNFITNKDSYSIQFNAMASPCEVIIQTTDKALALIIGNRVTKEVWRIEDKYNRYNQDSLCTLINNNAGKPIAIDEETYQLLVFADQCYQLSDGLFDISSGVLRKVWRFQGRNEHYAKFPSQTSINTVLPYVGWHKIHFDRQQITLARGMEIDFGGIGKEYAVDRSIILAKQLTEQPVLVNLGGDLAVSGPRYNNETWQVAIEHPDVDSHINQNADMIISLKSGALATSGDAKRFLIKDNIRYGHILNAKTGWPIANAPRSITAVAPQCIQAGILATLALLQGSNAEQFLTEQEIKFWSRR
ncbi:FAD:protein FMN transferase [Colwellia sp. 4_MG-2023]|uniref:FAD:protein FMN transferase n=1 Tax=unclassified Colwellia TaxID=196834 RepID=UPI0020919630|nr:MULTISPECIES: FAD:protein FMN transferase [unclassified Colwellia]MDO6486975.1 FAD:protein FMN transferase [Colwellia sp. 6_MG-2023]MDO6508015.1 FAD:protein FMN transferase [Colwellia sp. 5_MG-2023]MDO6556804.1 FAD:protein FMN transferase [Colwellia sp. 4_MG-2023]MDO6653750.1 FAD:protein FMN transferase [Colwellia sp. 3_MG-2023]MDO6666620.1 FAD:protein FMN transferase [Colwellia sp. 2_MG-2023]